MTKKKSIFIKLFVALVALTLISCCFLGSTFARYTSEDSGTASVNVAKWNIDMAGNAGTSGELDVTFTDQLSPDFDTPFSGSTNRTNATERLLVATIKNTGDVAATVTVTAGALEYAGTELGEVGITSLDSTEKPTQAQFNEVFSIKLYQNPVDNAEAATEISGEIELAAKTGIVYIYAEITWTTPDQTYGEAVADAIDTWFGENLTSIKSTITYRAVQASEIPSNPND